MYPVPPCRQNILIVTDTTINLRRLADQLAEKGYGVRWVANVNLACQVVQEQIPQLLIICSKVPAGGVQICQTLTATLPDTAIPIILLGEAQASKAQALPSTQFAIANVVDYITLPCPLNAVLQRVETQLALQQLHQQLQQAQEQQSQTEAALAYQRQKTQLFQWITGAIRSQAEGQKIFEGMVQQIGQVLQVERCSIHVYVPPPMPEILLIAEFVQPGTTSMRKIDFTLEDNLFIPAVLSSDWAIASTDVYADQQLQSIASLCHLAHIQSLLVVRTSYRNQANGMMMLQQCERQRVWTEDEIALVESIAAQVGMALAQAKSLEQEQKQLEALGYQNSVLRQEICERKLVESALQESEAELRGLFAAMMDVILVLDRQGRYLRIAPTNQDNLYKPAEDLLGQTLHDVFPLEQAELFLRYIHQTLDLGQAIDHEYCLTIRDQAVWFNAKISPFGKDTVLWVARDITPRKQSEAELLRKSITLKEFSNNLKHLHRLSLTDFKTIEALCADYLTTGCEILGYATGAVGQVVGQTYRLLAVHPASSALTVGTEFLLEHTYCRAVLQQRQTIFYGQVSQIEELADHPMYQALGIESYLGTPIWVDGEIYGTLCFFSPQAHHQNHSQGYSRHEPEIIELMAQSIGKFFSAHQVNAKRQQAEEEVQLLLNITQLITAAPDFNQALGAALQALCQTTGWIYGEVWLPSADGSVLECSPVWYCNSDNQSSEAIQAVQHLRQGSIGITFGPNEGIAGRVWSQQQPEWTFDSANDSTNDSKNEGTNAVEDHSLLFAGEHVPYRFQLVNQYGIKARLGIPIKVTGDCSLRGRAGSAIPLAQSAENSGSIELRPEAKCPVVLAVLVFFTIEARQQDQRLIQLVSAVATQLGTVLAQKQAEAELQTLFTAMSDVVLVRDANGRCLRVASANPKLHQPSASILGKTLHETLPLPIADQVLQGIQTSLQTHATVNLEYSVPLLNGEVCLSTSISPLSEASVLMVARDITDRKQVAEALARRERYLAALVDVQQELLAVRDQQAQYTEILRLLGQVSSAARVYLYQRQLDGAGRPLLVPRGKWQQPDCPIVESGKLANYLLNDNEVDWMQTLAQGAIIHSKVAAFPASVQTLLAAENICSILVFPLKVNGELWGLIGFDDCTEARSWDALEISLLSAAASAIALHHERKLSEDALRQSAEREQATLKVIERMRQTLDIQQIFRTTTEELRQLLKCDRVLIYQFNPDWSGECVAESVMTGWRSVVQPVVQPIVQTSIPVPTLTTTAIGEEPCVVKTWHETNLLQDTYLQTSQGGAYSRGAKYLCVQDVEQANFTPCYLQLLRQLQARAYLTVPIFQGNRLWGLLASYQNSGPRDWHSNEIHLVIHISTQLGVALQQADLLAQTQRQSADLEKAKDAAEAANRAKTQFLANMSHELRTPLNSILGFTQLIEQEAALSSEHQDYLAIINRSGHHLLELINDVLELAKLEAERVSLRSNQFDLYGLIDNIAQMLRLTATEKHLQFYVQLTPDVPQQVITDRRKLRQVLLNLLDNAIKFTQTGSVTLHVRQLAYPSDGATPPPEAASHCWLHFEVQDTGYGIAVEEMASLFEAFVQTEAGRQSNRGTGLGLTISHRLVQLMGGQLQVRSTLGVGSVFEFEIPVGVLEPSALETPNFSPASLPDWHLRVHCIYANTDSPLSTVSSSSLVEQSVILTELNLMPREWIANLDRAASGCSDRQVLELIEQIPPTQTHLIERLAELVYDFRFEEIVELTKFQQQ